MRPGRAPGIVFFLSFPARACFCPPSPNNRAHFGSPAVAALSYDVGVAMMRAFATALGLTCVKRTPWSWDVVIQLQGVRRSLLGGLPWVRINVGA